MKRHGHVATCLCVLGLGFASAPDIRPAMAEEGGANRSDVLRSVLPTVVNISVRKPEENASGAMTAARTSSGTPVVKTYVGSGFVIDADGYIVTNYHVVENAYQITVMLADGTVLPGKTLTGSRIADLALVKVAADHKLPAAHWGNSDALQVGDQVFAAGDPFGIGTSVSAGIVSGLNRDIQNSPYDDLIQTDATINHGNSGGPLFDMQGNVVGVDSAIISPTTGSSGLGFAIPSNTARFILDHLRTYGWIRPAWIGVKLQQVTPEMARGLGMTKPEGSIVAWVLPGSPARKAGLEIGDVVLRFGDRTPSDERALLRDIAQSQVGDAVPLVVLRGGQEHTMTVTTQEWPRDQWDRRDAPVAVRKPKIVIPRDLGLSMAPISPSRKSAMGLEARLNGVLITGVSPNSDPDRQGLVNGDVILRVGDKAVASPAEVQNGIDAARADKRDYMLMLVLPKVREVPGPKWIALDLGADSG